MSSAAWLRAVVAGSAQVTPHSGRYTSIEICHAERSEASVPKNLVVKQIARAVERRPLRLQPLRQTHLERAKLEQADRRGAKGKL